MHEHLELLRDLWLEEEHDLRRKIQHQFYKTVSAKKLGIGVFIRLVKEQKICRAVPPPLIPRCTVRLRRVNHTRPCLRLSNNRRLIER